MEGLPPIISKSILPAYCLPYYSLLHSGLENRFARRLNYLRKYMEVIENHLYKNFYIDIYIYKYIYSTLYMCVSIYKYIYTCVRVFIDIY